MANQDACVRVLADILEAKKVEAFDMNYFFYQSRLSVPKEKSEFIIAANKVDNMCGTTMCIAGFAGLNAGYTATGVQRTFTGYDGETRSYYDIYWSDPSGTPLHSDSEPSWFDVGMEYLDLECWQAAIIFYGTHDHGRQSLEILKRLASGDEITIDEWKEYSGYGGTYSHRVPWDSNSLYDSCLQCEFNE